MAIRVIDEFGSRANPPDAAYPDGSLKNETTPGVSNDGSPLDERVGNDWEGFKQSALAESGIAANGSPDSVDNPQILNAIKKSNANVFSNSNLLSNSNFLIPSPDAITHPNATPESYASGTQIFSGVYAGSGGCTVTFINGRVNCTTGDYQFKLANTNGLDRVPIFTSSVSDYDGNPATTGVSHALVGDEYVVTVTPVAGDVFSVKLEQGDLATKHEVQGFKGQTYTFNTVAEMVSASPPINSLVETKERESGKGGGADYEIIPLGVAPHPALDFVLPSGLIAAYIQTNDHVNCKQAGVFSDGVDHTGKWLELVDIAGNFPSKVNRIYCPAGTYQLELFKSMPKMEVYGDGALNTVFELTHTGSYSTTMGQIGTDCYIHDLQLSSQMTDLDQQRVEVESRSTLDRVISQGFRDITGATDAWGIYLKNVKDVRIIQCGFDNNTQSDIAIVDDCTGVLIDGCYGLGSEFHINIEPNVITTRNRAITLSNMQLSRLSLIETTGGGTSTTVNIEAVRADTLYYAGSRATFDACNFVNHAVSGGTGTLWFGEAQFRNSLAIGENLLRDPYLSLVGINTSEANNEGYLWKQQDVAGSMVSTETSLAQIEDGLRYTRLNPNSYNGRFQWAVNESIPLAAGSNILVAVTGRWVSGTSDAFIRVSDGVNQKVGRIFRQGDLNSNYFTTELCIIPILANGDLQIEIGLPQTTDSVIDIVSITAHKVLTTLNGRGANASDVLRKIHGNTGPRETEWNSLPNVIRAVPNGIQIKDRVTVGVDEYVYDGALGFKQVSLV